MDENIQRDLGKLLEQGATILKQQEEIYAQIDELKNQNVDVKLALLEVTHAQEDLEKKLEAMLPDVQFWSNMKQRGIGIISVLGVFCTALGYYFDKILKP